LCDEKFVSIATYNPLDYIQLLQLYKFDKNLQSNMAALRALKQADLFLYAVPVFENHPPILSLPKLANTCVSEHGLE